MQITQKNLKDALQGESEAKVKYELFANKAKEEGYSLISKIFQAISFAESIHIKNHLRALSVISQRNYHINDVVKIDENELHKQVKSTRENLKNAADGEIYESKIMYKGFVKNAKKENSDVAELSFELARKAEKVHAGIFKDYLKSLDKNEIPVKKIFVCQICGNVEFQKPPENCPVCDHSQEFYKEI